MTGTSTRTVGDVCVAAFQRLLEECMFVRGADLYLLSVQVAAREDESEIRHAHDEFVDLLKPRYESPSRYFLERSFILLVAAFEFFLQDVISSVVLVNPKKVGQIEFKLSEIIDASDNDELIRRSIDSTLNKLMYKKPMDYLVDAAGLLSIDPTPLKSNWAIFAEAKARRDLGVHNGWICNSIYLRKITEAGLSSNFYEGQSTAPTDRSYLNSVGDALVSLGSQIVDSVLLKHKESLHKVVA